MLGRVNASLERIGLYGGEEYQKAIKTMMLRHNDFSPRLVVEKELGLEKWQTQWRELISSVEKTG